jgi:hypothetical protein
MAYQNVDWTTCITNRLCEESRDFVIFNRTEYFSLHCAAAKSGTHRGMDVRILNKWRICEVSGSLFVGFEEEVGVKRRR